MSTNSDDWPVGTVKDQQNTNSEMEEGTEENLYKVVVNKLSNFLTTKANSKEDLKICKKCRKSKKAPRVLMWNGTRKRKPSWKMRHRPPWSLRPKVGTAQVSDSDSDSDSDTPNDLCKYASVKDMMKANNVWKDEYDIEINVSLKPDWLRHFKDYLSYLGRVIAPDGDLKTKNFEKCQKDTNLPLQKEAKNTIVPLSEMLKNCKLDKENEVKKGANLNVAGTPDNNTHILIENDENLM